MPKSIGPRKVYVHRDYIHTLPEWAQTLYQKWEPEWDFEARKDWNVIKIDTASDLKITLLTYENFELVEHPKLVHAFVIRPIDGHGRHISYRTSDNKPILHRKECLVDETHPQYATWRELSEEEEGLGLLSRPDIGTEIGFNRALKEAGVKILFYNLVER